MEEQELITIAKRINDYFKDQGDLYSDLSFSTSTKRQLNLGYLTKEDFAQVIKITVDDLDALAKELKLLGIIKIKRDYSVNPSESLIYPGSLLKEFAHKTIATHLGPVFYEGFDQNRGVLMFAGKEIKLSKKMSTVNDPMRLMTAISKDVKRAHFFDELMEDFEGSDWIEARDRVRKHKFYDAAKKVNQLVAAATTIDDFLVAAIQSYQINPKYVRS